jgi:hypothetical protein
MYRRMRAVVPGGATRTTWGPRVIPALNVKSATEATGSAASFSVISTSLFEFDWPKVGALSIASPIATIVTAPWSRFAHPAPAVQQPPPCRV